MELPTKLKMSVNQLILIWSMIIIWALAGLFLFAKTNIADIDQSAHRESHIVIAITCPYQPFFDWGDHKGAEWQLIARAFEKIGFRAQHLYVSKEEASRLFVNGNVGGIWLCGAMQSPANDYYHSVPLMKRDFVAVSLVDKNLKIDNLGDLTNLKLGIHPVFEEVLGAQLNGLISDADSTFRIPNHLRLSSMLFAGELEVLIVEYSVFTHSLEDLPDEIDSGQEIEFHRIFDPVYPRIVFEDESVRNRFDQAWKYVFSKTESI